MYFNKIAQTLLAILGSIVNMIWGALSYGSFKKILSIQGRPWTSPPTLMYQPQIESLRIGIVLHSEQEKPPLKSRLPKRLKSLKSLPNMGRLSFFLSVFIGFCLSFSMFVLLLRPIINDTHNIAGYVVRNDCSLGLMFEVISFFALNLQIDQQV